jgi:hypothetical protein
MDGGVEEAWLFHCVILIRFRAFFRKEPHESA